ncbi:WD40 repeat domain-containing protein [bacterium]|nr:WD40 repeat domain-containing protein [bacterium]
MEEPVVLDAHGKHAQAVHFTRSSKLLVSTGQDAKVRLWSLPKLEPAGVFSGHTKCVYTLSFSPDEERLATVASDGTARIWSFPKGETLRVLEKTRFAIFSPDGESVATFDPKFRVALRDAATGETRWASEKIDARLFCLAFSPDGKLLLAGGAGAIHRLDAATGESRGSLRAHAPLVVSLRFSPDGKTLASTGADGTAQLWSARDFSKGLTISLGGAGYLQAVWSPDGKELAVSRDGVVEIFSTKDGKQLEKLEVPLKGVYGIAISPDGKWLANAAADGRVRVWRR